MWSARECVEELARRGAPAASYALFAHAGSGCGHLRLLLGRRADRPWRLAAGLYLHCWCVVVSRSDRQPGRARIAESLEPVRLGSPSRPPRESERSFLTAGQPPVGSAADLRSRGPGRSLNLGHDPRRWLAGVLASTSRQSRSCSPPRWFCSSRYVLAEAVGHGADVVDYLKPWGSRRRGGHRRRLGRRSFDDAVHGQAVYALPAARGARAGSR